MFDKIRLRIEKPKPWHSSDLRERGFTSPFDSRGNRWYQVVQVNPACELKLKWFSTCRKHYLSAEVSLPKLLYGNNVRMLSESDPPRALDLVSELVSERAQVNFDAAQAFVTYLEVCYNWRLTRSEVFARIQALHGGSYPRMLRYPIADSTVAFKNKSAWVSCYDKHSQMFNLPRNEVSDEALRESIGVFRLEHKFIDTSGFDDFSVRSLLTPDFAKRTLEDDVRKLGLDKPIQSKDARLDLVADKFGLFSAEQDSAAKFLAYGEKYGFENLVSLGMKPRTIDRYKKILRDAGASLSTNEKRIYSPLHIVLSSDRLSNTSELESQMAEQAKGMAAGMS